MANDRADISCVVSAPGKVILFGEHSVVYKKAAVSTSINRRLFVTLNTVEGNKIYVKFPQIETDMVCNLEQFQKVAKEKCPLQSNVTGFTFENPENIDHNEYLLSLASNLESLGISLNDLQEKTRSALIGLMFVVRGMCHTLKCHVVPFILEVKSDLEVGAGTGSSAAFAVAVAGTILHYRKCLEINNNLMNYSVNKVNDNVIIKSYSEKSGFSLEEVKVINKWAYCVEKIMHGQPSGIDNTTCTFGSVVLTSQEENRPGNLMFRFLGNIPKISVLLISTGVSRNTSNLVAKVRQLRENNLAAVNAILNAMDVIALEASKTLQDLGSSSCNTSQELELYKLLGGLMEMNHGLLRTLGVSHESLEHIIRVSSHYGLSSKLTGAGGGGYAITLVPPNFSQDQLAELKKELGQTFKVTQINIAQEGIRLENSSKIRPGLDT